MASAASPINLIFSACNANPSPQVLDCSLQTGLIAYGSHYSIIILNWQSSHPYFKTQQILYGHSSYVTCLKWITQVNNDNINGNIGTILVSGSHDNSLIVWRMSDILFVKHQILTEHHGAIIGISVCSFSNGRIIIFSSSSDKSLVVWKSNISNNFNLVWKLHSNSFTFCSDLLRISSRNSNSSIVIAIGGSDNNIKFYHLDQVDSTCHLREMCKLIGHDDWLKSLEFKRCHNGDILLASASQDNTIRIWRIYKNKDELVCSHANEKLNLLELKTIYFNIGHEKYSIVLETVLYGHEDWVYSIAWNVNSSSEQLLSASIDKSIIIWELNKTTKIWSEQIREGRIGDNTFGFYGARFSSDGHYIIAHDSQGTIHVWINKDNQWIFVNEFGGHFGSINDLSWCSNGSYIHTASSDKSVRLWSYVQCDMKLNTSCVCREIARTQIHGYEVMAIKSINYLSYVSGADERVIRIFHAPQSFISTFNALTNNSNKKNIQATDNMKTPITCQNSALGLSNKSINNQNFIKTDKVDYYTFASKNQLSNEFIKHTFWPEHRKLYGHSFEIYSLCVSPDTELISSSCKATTIENAYIIIWNAHDLKAIQYLKCHTLTITQLAFSPDSNYLLAVSRDRTWSIWKRSLTNRNQLLIECHSKQLNANHSRVIWACSWAHNSIFATGSRDKTIIIWSYKPITPNNKTEDSAICISKNNEIKSNYNYNLNYKGDEGNDYIACKDLPLWNIIGDPINVKESVTAIDFFPICYSFNSYLMAVGLENGRILLLTINITNGLVLNLLYFDKSICHGDVVRRIQWRPIEYTNTEDKAILASCGSDLKFHLYNIDIDRIFF